MNAEESVWTPERSIGYPLITELDLSADGEWVAYTVREPLLTEDESRFVTHIYRVPVNGGEPLRLTFGSASNSAPRISPDGRHIAFLSNRDDKKRNLYVMQMAGGEAWPLTKVEKDVTAFDWAPDGQRLAMVMPAPDSEEKKAAKSAKDDAILWGVDHDRARLWLVGLVPGGAERPEPLSLTDDHIHVTGFAWAPDGGALAVVHQPTPCADDWKASRLAVVELGEGEHQLRDLGTIGTSEPSCRARGRQVICSSGGSAPSWIFHGPKVNLNCPAICVASLVLVSQRLTP